MACGVESVEYGVRSVVFVECRMWWSVAYGVWSVVSGVRSVECKVLSVE